MPPFAGSNPAAPAMPVAKMPQLLDKLCIALNWLQLVVAIDSYGFERGFAQVGLGKWLGFVSA